MSNEKTEEMPTIERHGVKPPPVAVRETATVERVGNKIIIPDGMSYATARNWLTKQEQAEESQVAIHDEIPCFPLDGVLALTKALDARYGFFAAGGWAPPCAVQVPTASGKMATALLGELRPPIWEGGFIQAEVGGREAKLVISGQVKRKFEGEIKAVIMAAREMLKTDSIYRRQAIRLDLSFMYRMPPSFNPISDAPQFMDVSNVNEGGLILNPVTEFELSANIFTIIEQTAACRRNQIPLKHGCLLMGPYGTGKTLTAAVMASKCVRNGWTFIYLKNAAHLADALRIAQLYAPAVLFAEDIDQAVNGEDRTESMNEILNTLDGVDTKGKPIVTVLTTNHPENINTAFLRAGRIDTVVSFDPPDAKTAVRFIRLFAQDDDGQNLLAPAQDLAEAGKELAGFVPAFIAEAVQKAKRFAIHREGADITGKLLATDLVLAAQALQKHVKMVNRETPETTEATIAKAVMNVGFFQRGRDLPYPAKSVLAVTPAPSAKN